MPLIVGQDTPLRLLSVLLKKGKIPHAMMFTGIEGAGKRAAAVRFAMACNCEGDKEASDSLPPHCESCRSCRKIASGIHPDLCIIEPSGVFIKIDQIRELGNLLAMKPYEAKIRVVIIAEAGAMNPEASNALLKMLEEPPDRTILILTAREKTDLLPTIVSRCQPIRFMPVKQESKENAEQISRNQRILKELCALSLQPLNVALSFAEKLAKDKDKLRSDLMLMASWFRDLALCRALAEKGQVCNENKLIHKDMKDELLSEAYHTPTSQILTKLDAIYSAMKNLRSNSNVRLTSDVLVMKLIGGG